jgi:L,D-transpeptidase catalytic domain
MFGRRLPRHLDAKSRPRSVRISRFDHPCGLRGDPGAKAYQDRVRPPNDDLLVASVGGTNGTSMIRFAKLRCKKVRQLASTAIATLALLVATGNFAEAGSSRKGRSIELITTRTAGEPIMAIVSLRSQRITVYDADGWIMRAPVSSGQAGRETPAGIFSVIQKDAEHHSNLYDDAYMPHMQRLTWSGIALHGGLLPGHPASHGCIRLPYDFAAHLFDLTKLGMRVIVAPSDVAPVSIAHPALFEPRLDARDAAAARVSEAEEAAKRADQARLAALTASRAVAQATMPLRRMRNLKLREEERLADAERSITSADSVEAKEAAEAAKANSAAKIAELEAQLVPAEAELQPIINALADARKAAVAAEKARVEAVGAAHTLARPEPMSIFISRKTQRLYVRQAFESIFDIPITIRDTDLPIGTHVFTALERGGGKGDMQWSVVSFVGSNVGMSNSQGTTYKALDAAVNEAGLPSAKAALDRVVIPEDTVDRITQLMSPRSSLIISDEGPSLETGRGTEFVIVMSDEPQGGLAHRPQGPDIGVRYEFRRDRIYWHSPFGNAHSSWYARSNREP